MGNYYVSDYLSKPFTLIDFFVICIFAIVAIIIVIVMEHFTKRLGHIRYIYKLLLFIPAFILASIIVGLSLGEIIVIE